MDADMLAWCESRGLTVLGKMSEGYDGTTCHQVHGRHYHCANCDKMSSYQGHMMGSPPAFTCQPAASTTREVGGVTLRRECDVCGGQWKHDIADIAMTTLEVPAIPGSSVWKAKRIDICSECLKRVHEAIVPIPKVGMTSHA